MPKPRPAKTTRTTDQDAVATAMAMLLPVHAAPSLAWLADATATAAERVVNAPFAILYLEDEDGALVRLDAVSDLRRRSQQRAFDAFGDALPGQIDPSAAPAIEAALADERVFAGEAREGLAGLAAAQSLIEAQRATATDAAAIVPLCCAGERLGALIALCVGVPDAELLRLLGEHIACAALNLRQGAHAGIQLVATAEPEVVRTVFDPRKTEADLQREIARAGRYGREASIAVIEATNLRLLRERFGQRLTEELLDRLGMTLAQHSRDIDVIGQYKQSGFTMILSEATAEGAQSAARRLHAIAHGAAADDSTPDLELHLATGWATFPADGATSEALFASAERRMYDPKSQVA